MLTAEFIALLRTLSTRFEVVDVGLDELPEQTRRMTFAISASRRAVTTPTLAAADRSAVACASPSRWPRPARRWRSCRF